MKKKTYILVQSDNYAELENEVNRLMNEEDFIPQGGVAMAYDTESYCEFLAQAMVSLPK